VHQHAGHWWNDRLVSKRTNAMSCLFDLVLHLCKLLVIFSFGRTKMSKRGQTSIPARVRKQLDIGPNTTLEWVIEGASARVVPFPRDPIRAFRGSGKKGLANQLVRERRRERKREDASRR
jgi:bifunctional DNA-binding transcriptional regulator/antitoxin component of YhaV-PrlF toxin-antitoxin module